MCGGIKMMGIESEYYNVMIYTGSETTRYNQNHQLVEFGVSDCLKLTNV